MLQNCLRTFITCCLMMMLFGQSLLAQEPVSTATGLTGRVLDDYARPLSGVVVTVKGASLRDTTGIDGSFSFNTAAPATLIFSHPLYETREKKLTSSRKFTLRMTETYLRVTNGADTAVLVNKFQRKTDLLYESKPADKIISSVSTVYGNQLRTTPSSLYLNALQGRLAGLNINQVSGFYTANTTPQIDVDIFVGNIPKNNSGTGPSDNSEFDVQLRGHSGSRGQSPLVIIDGVQRDIYSLDPQNIESVSILKDALSTILVGQNSSRGVMLVTTKNPTAGAPHLSFTAEVGTQSSLGLPKPLPAYQYAYLLNEALANEGRSAAYTADDFNAYRNGTDPLGHPDVNWYNTILKDNALMSRYNLNIQGGGSRARYIVSLGYLNQDGMYRTDNANSYNTNLELKRYLLNSKVDIDVNDKLSVAFQLFGRLQQGNQPGATSPAILQSLLNTPNNAYPTLNPNGSYGGNSNYRNNLLSMVQNSGYINDNTNDVMANLDLNYKLDRFLPGLYFRGRGNVSVQSSSILNRFKQAPVYTLVVTPGGDSAYNLFGAPINQVNQYTSTSWARYTFAQLSLGYDKQIGDHNLQTMVLFDQKTTLLNYDIPGKLTNIAGKASYDFKGKYLAEAALNYSGYNRYKPGNQYGAFYAFGLGWNVAKERFILDNVSWINEMKLRATFGQTGSANVDNYGYYIYRSYFQDVAGTYPIGDGYPNGGGLAEGGNLPSNNVMANINATWEKAHKFDAGIDLSLFGNRIQFTADYYYERYYDVLQERGRSIELIGQRYPAENIGVNRFSGWEFTGTYQSHFRDLNFFITGNASIQQSRVLFADEQYQPYEWNKRTGQMVGQRFGLIVDGLVQSFREIATTPTTTGYALKVGDVKYRDLTGDGVIDMFDAAPIGKQKPLIYFGLNMGLSFKGLSVSALIQGVTNRDTYAGNNILEQGFLNQGNGFTQAYEQVLGRWTPESVAGASGPRLTPGGSIYNYSPLLYSTTAQLHDGNYFRLKNVSVEYNLPYQLIRNLKLSGVKLFFTAQNLATWAAYDVQDPEVTMPNYPTQKVVNFGINIKI